MVAAILTYHQSRSSPHKVKITVAIQPLRRARMSYIRTLAVVVLALVASPLAHATKQIMVVDCSKGASLAKAVMSADEHTTLSVFGTCTGAVSITTKGLTLDGNGSAIVTAPNANVITVNGAERVAINHIKVARGGTRAGG